MHLANIFQLGVKELRGLARDKIMVALIVYVFSVSVYGEATAIPEVLHNATIMVADEDHSPLSERIIDDFYPPRFTVPAVVTPTEMDQRMDAGQNTFAIDVPPHFQRDLLAGRSPAIQLNVDATRMTQAFGGTIDVESIAGGEIADFARRYRSSSEPFPVDVDLRVRYNPNRTQMWFAAISSIIENIAMITIILAGSALIREREHGTVEHLLVMPVRPVEILISKIWSMGLVVLVVATLSIILMVQGVLAVPVKGSLWLFTLGAALDVVASAGMGIALATFADSMPQFAMLTILVLVPLQVLSGGLTPRESMPWIIRTLMLGAPDTHFVIIAQSILFRGAGFSVVWPEYLILTAIGSGLFLLSLTQFRRFLH